MAILSILLPIAASFLFIKLIWPPQKGMCASVIQLSMSTGLGLGLSAISYYIFSIISGFYTSSSIRVETLLFAGWSLLSILLLVLSRRMKRGYPIEMEPHHEGADENVFVWKKIPVLALGFWVIFAGSIGAFIMRTLNYPHGAWDAWAIWNLRARFLFRGQENWIEAFTPTMESMTHVDYPLLIPGAIARIWSHMNAEPLFVPALVAFLFTVSIVGLLTVSIAQIKNRSHEYLAGILLLSIPFFTIHGASQFADLPMAFFVLAALVLLVLKDEAQGANKGMLVLTGMMASLSAWTKNEGLLFVLVFFSAHFMVTILKKGWRAYVNDIVPLAAGALPFLVVVIHFKMRINIPNDLVSGRSSASLIPLIIDGNRYLMIGKALVYYLAKSFLSVMIIVPVMAMLFRFSIENRSLASMMISFLTIFLLLSGYSFIYLITPHDLTWHLKTSMSRLYLHVVPSFLFLFFASLRGLKSNGTKRGSPQKTEKNLRQDAS